MNRESVTKSLSWLSQTGAAGLLTWWFLMPLFLPVSEAASQFQEMVLHRNWIPVNMVGLISALIITVGFTGFYLHQFEELGRMGLLSFILALSGLVLFSGIQYYETLIWPAAASINPGLVQVNGVLVSGNQGVLAGLFSSGIVLGAGFILFGISALRTRAFPKTPTWLILVGAPVFGNGIVFPARTIGLILFCTGLIWWSVKLRTQDKDS